MEETEGEGIRVTTKGDIRLIKKFARLKEQPWRAVLATFSGASPGDQANARRRMKAALGLLK